MRRWLPLVAAALVLTGCGSTTADYPPAPMATAGSATGTLLAYGTVTDDGKPVAGARVVLQVEPADDSAAPSTGGEKRWSAPAVTTGKDGAWALHLNAKDVPPSYLPSSHSFLEFDLVFGNGARLSVWSGTVYLRNDPDVWRTEAAGPDDDVLKVDADLGTGDLTAVDSLGKPLASGQ